jgi:hypothetical protein
MGPLWISQGILAAVSTENYSIHTLIFSVEKSNCFLFCSHTLQNHAKHQNINSLCCKKCYIITFQTKQIKEETTNTV